jgi:hypothetical protein
MAFIISVLNGCSSSKAPIAQTTAVSGPEWSFQAPDTGWWFIHRGKGNKTVLAGSSYYNLGSRPMVVALSKHCDLSPTNDPSGDRIGHATKWIGGRLGELQAFRESARSEEQAIMFIAKVHEADKCQWIFTCEGDARRAREVEAICTKMVDTLEFH